MATVLITGCSSGIGLATATELARAGHQVVATMRSLDRASALREIIAAERLPIKVAELDVKSDASVSSCFGALSGPIDVLVNNAGVEYHGSVEETPIESFVDAIQTNYLGAVRCIKAVVPAMRQARSGCIINISSIAGKIAGSPLGAYSASKFALESLSETLAGELKPFNVRVAIVEPGIQDTKMARAICAEEESCYCQPRRFNGLFRAALRTPVPPSTTALVIRDIIESGTWQLRHASGPDAAPFLGWRSSLTDEQWVDWNALDDEAWCAQVQKDFGMDVRPEARAAGTAE